jgi:6-phosphofructokinase 1
VVRKGVDEYGDELIGFRDGWRGPLEDVVEELTIESTRGILPRGGTILGSSRTNIFKRPDGVDQVRQTFERHRLDGLIAIGGEDTLGAASGLFAEGLNVIGVPKTIDNDLGAPTSVSGSTRRSTSPRAIDRLHTTAESHHRNLVVRSWAQRGWIALHSGLAGGADVIPIRSCRSTSARSAG